MSGPKHRSGPFVFAVNHASYLDAIPVMAALSIDYAFSFSGMVQLKEETAELIAHEVGEPRLDLVAPGPVRS